MNIMIRKLTQDEYNNAADLSYQVCMECGRNDFTQEGKIGRASCRERVSFGV